MKTTKLFALLLSLVLLCSTVCTTVAFASNETAQTASYPTYDEAEEGELLYKADFRGDDIFRPALTYSYHASWGEAALWGASTDGNELTMKGYSFVTGKLNGMPLDNQHVYTITYTSEMASTYNVYQGLYIDVNENYKYGTTAGTIGYNGFRSIHNSVACAQNGGNISVNGSTYMMYSAANNNSSGTGICPYTEAGTAQLNVPYEKHQYKLVVDGPNNTLSYFVLCQTNDATPQLKWTQLYCIDLAKYNSSFKSDTLHLAFQSYWAYNTLSVKYSDVNVYKGLTDNGISVNKSGELLLDLGDLSKAHTGSNGATYTPDIDQSYATAKTLYSYDAENNQSVKTLCTDTQQATAETASYSVYGGTTNLRLGYGNQYTITYLAKFAEGANGSAGLRYACTQFTSSQGEYRNVNNAVCIAKGTMTGENSCNGAYVSYTDDMREGGSSEGSLYYRDGYAKVAIEIDNYEVTVYINGVAIISYSVLDHKAKTVGFSSEHLTVALYEYIGIDGNWGTPFAYYKDIKVYAGLTTGRTTVQMINGDTVEELVLKGEEYELPLPEARKGFVFGGWRINGTDTVKSSGEVIATEGLQSVEAVWTAIMSSTWVQFKENADNTRDMRVVSMIDSIDYSALGYDVVIHYTDGGVEKTFEKNGFELTTVYSSLTAKYGQEIVTLKTLGFDSAEAGYLTSFVIRGIPTNTGTVVMELKPYYTVAGYSNVTYGSSTTITLVNGALQ